MKTGINIEQALTTTAAVVVCVIVVLTFCFSRLDRARRETHDMIDRISVALGVRLDSLSEKVDHQGKDVAELKGMARTSQRRDRRHDRDGGE